MADDNVISDNDQLNRKTTGKLKLLGWVSLGAVLTILYIANVFQINDLLKEKVQQEKKYNAVLNSNKMLMRRLNYLQSPERITKIAKDEFGMIKSEKVPEALPKKVNK